jgi:hypothetical protein
MSFRAFGWSVGCKARRIPEGITRLSFEATEVVAMPHSTVEVAVNRKMKMKPRPPKAPAMTQGKWADSHNAGKPPAKLQPHVAATP